MAQARLNRRRYREAVTALKQVISDTKAPQQRRLHAIELLLSIYDKGDRHEQRKDSQRRAREVAEQPEQTADSTSALDTILERLQAERETEVLS